MKTCPQCRQTYDDNLNYCLNDGTPLTADDHAAPTIAMQPPPSTAGQQPAPTVPQWQPQPEAKAPRSSRTWIWVVLILGVAVVLCGSGIGGVLLLTRDRSAGNSAQTTPQPNRSTPDPTLAKTKKHGGYDLSMEQFNQLDIGMKRSDVERILGGKGNELSSSTGGGTRYTVDQWQGENFKSVILSFENDKLTDKTQVGLDDPDLDN